MEQKQRAYTDREYRNIKQREREVIAQMLDELKSSKDRRYLFRDKHVTTDIKDMLNYSAENHPTSRFSSRNTAPSCLIRRYPSGVSRKT